MGHFEDYKEKDENGKTVKTTVQEINTDEWHKDFSDYARFFDASCQGHTKDPETNLIYLKHQQAYCNELLKARGFLFLNDVYEILDIPKTKAGQIVGWLYNKDGNTPTNGDGYVDFGIYDPNYEASRRFVNGCEYNILLDFNVDGPIFKGGNMKNVLIFVAGAATGAFVTYKFVAKYYKDESDKEIQSVIDTFNERKNNLREEIKKENEMKVEKENKTNKKEDKEQNATIIHTENYGSVDVETAAEQLINMSPEDAANFIIIHPNDYGDQDDYELKSWLLWSDGVLTDENDEIIDIKEKQRTKSYYYRCR